MYFPILISPNFYHITYPDKKGAINNIINTYRYLSKFICLGSLHRNIDTYCQFDQFYEIEFLIEIERVEKIDLFS